MVPALWMERLPADKYDDDSHNKVGAVLVLPNDISSAVDCSRNGTELHLHKEL